MEQPTITITLPVNSVDLGGALDAARALTAHLEAAQEMLGRLRTLVEKGYAVDGPAAAATPVAGRLMSLWKRQVSFTRCAEAGRCVFVLLHRHGDVCGVECTCSACSTRTPLAAT